MLGIEQACLDILTEKRARNEALITNEEDGEWASEHLMGVTCEEVASRLGVEVTPALRASLSRALRSLEGKGLVQLLRKEEDGQRIDYGSVRLASQ